MKVFDCGSDFIDFHELTEFQGDFKQRTDTDLQEIKSKIIEYGFSFPMFVWETDDKKYVIDGHGRLGALKLLEEEGEEIPLIPVVYIHAEDTKQAIRLLLLCNSRFGYITNTSTDMFMDGVAYEEFLSSLNADDMILVTEEEAATYKENEIFCPMCGTVCGIEDGG